jgi:lysophospholipase L1-like esterase
MKELVLLGDSHLSRHTEDAGEVLAPKFSANFPEIHIVNLAKGGVNSNYALDVLPKSQLPESFISIVLFGTNDAAPWKQVPINIFTENYRKLITYLKNNGCSDLILVTPPPVNIQKQIPPGRSNEVLQNYSEAVKQLAAEYQTKCLDLFSILIDAMKTSDVHFQDGVHLNSQGYDIFFKEIQRLIN